MIPGTKKCKILRGKTPDPSNVRLCTLNFRSFRGATSQDLLCQSGNPIHYHYVSTVEPLPHSLITLFSGAVIQCISNIFVKYVHENKPKVTERQTYHSSSHNHRDKPSSKVSPNLSTFELTEVHTKLIKTREKSKNRNSKDSLK